MRMRLLPPTVIPRSSATYRVTHSLPCLFPDRSTGARIKGRRAGRKGRRRIGVPARPRAHSAYQRTDGAGTAVIGLGCMRLSSLSDDARAIAVIHAALDAGATLLDTADVYAPDDVSIGH